MSGIPFLSTRLFPKGRGALGYEITGVASRCDWVILSDFEPPHCALVKQIDTDTPRYIFLSLRQPFEALKYFVTTVLPLLSSPFVLISGSEDATIPNQIDKRWRPFNVGERAAIATILANKLLLHWFAENLDDPAMPRTSALPVGMVYPEGPHIGLAELPKVRPLAQRPLTALFAQRIRSGKQWDLRRHVLDLARGPWAEFTTVLEQEVPEDTFLGLVEQHAFVICVEGGGVDPSPKAWQSLIHGAVPIICSPGVCASYTQLPVAIVDNWSAETLSLPRLGLWRNELILQMDGEKARQSLHNHLSLDYWWNKIVARYEQSWLGSVAQIG